jgi:hypothetical protein
MTLSRSVTARTTDVARSMNTSPHADARARRAHARPPPRARPTRVAVVSPRLSISGVVTTCRHIARIARVSASLSRARARTVESPPSTVVTVAALAPHPILARLSRAS